jgi:SH3-like domain-containing protein
MATMQHLQQELLGTLMRSANTSQRLDMREDLMKRRSAKSKVSACVRSRVGSSSGSPCAGTWCDMHNNYAY